MRIAPEARMRIAPEARMRIAPEARVRIAPEARMEHHPPWCVTAMRDRYPAPDADYPSKP